MTNQTTARVSASNSPTYSAFAIEVFAWGRQNPWEGNPRLNHSARFAWSDVQTDGAGNVLNMPLLKGKPCFGMPQVFVRHGKRTRMTRTKYGTQIETETHRCGRCKIRDSCLNLTSERLKSDRNIWTALVEWNRFCARYHNGIPTFSREAGRYWQKFLQALADRGPFANSNDVLLAEQEALDRKKGLEKWRRDKLRQRANERASRRAAGLPPPDAFIAEAMFQRDLRANELIALGCSDNLGIPLGRDF